MTFYVLLAAINVLSFMPLYLLNVREQPNPFAFLSRHAVDRSKLKFLYARPRLTDPFRINFDFTFLALLAAAAGEASVPVLGLLSAVLAFGFVEILYVTIIQSIFKRPPMLASDVALIRAGLNIAQAHAWWIVPGVVALALAIGGASLLFVRALLAVAPEGTVAPLLVAASLVPPCCYHATSYDYGELISRTVYSPLLHVVRNVRLSLRSRRLRSLDAATVERHNEFADVELVDAPNIIVVCVESYGSIVHRDPRYHDRLAGLLAEREQALVRAGYRFASTFSEAPIFAGGSWASYTSFTYGLRIDDLQLFDGLFAAGSAFTGYESLFHVLRRSGYENVLLCPLGGIDAQTVDWAAIDRCFQSQRRIDFDALGYRGPLVNYLGLVRRCAAPDQFSLNFAYEQAKAAGGPFSLFFCTLNSHYPWRSPSRAVADWRTLDDPDLDERWDDSRAAREDRYADAIAYQLDYLLRFAVERAADDPLIVLFGDHQPPLITPEPLGKSTPVHVLGRDPAVIDTLLERGFAPCVDLGERAVAEIEHAAFLSLFLRALNIAHGRRADAEVPFRRHGNGLFDEPGLAARG